MFSWFFSSSKKEEAPIKEDIRGQYLDDMIKLQKMMMKTLTMQQNYFQNNAYMQPRFSNVKVFRPEANDPTFDDLIGAEEVKQRINTMLIVPLEEKRLRISGFLLSGKIGNGKTSIMKATSKLSTSINFIYIDTRALNRIENADYCKYLVSVFEKAKKLGLCIVLIDEIDEILHHEGMSTIFSSYLPDPSIAVIGASNLIHAMDERVKQRLINQEVVNPGVEQRRSFFKSKLRSSTFDEANLILGLDEMIDLTEGLAWRELVNLCLEIEADTNDGRKVNLELFKEKINFK